MDITIADQDSDALYVTNNSAIVECARKFYLEYPTIVNNIPKEPNKYTNSMINYAKIDNKLSASKLGIGESSNLAQLSLTYSYNFNDSKYQDYVCILSVIAQICIDSAKRSFDIDTNSEINRIKNDMDIGKNKYPVFWKNLKRGFSEDKINNSLKCPMNSINELTIREFKPDLPTLPMNHFFKQFDMDINKRKSKKIEELIEKYSLDIYNNINEKDDYILNMDNFEDLINDIKRVYISKNYLGLMSWLINRAFIITPSLKSNVSTLNSKTNNNKSLLLKVLYDVNKEALLKCFSNNIVDNE